MVWTIFFPSHRSLGNLNTYPSEQLVSYVIPRERTVEIVQYRAFCTCPSNSNPCERYQRQYLRKYRLHPCWIPSLWNHGNWVGRCRILRHFDQCAEPHGRRRHCCWTCGWACDERARNAITWLCIDDDCDLAHLDQRLLTRVEAEKRCLIIQGQYRMGTAVLTICGLWH